MRCESRRAHAVQDGVGTAERAPCIERGGGAPLPTLRRRETRSMADLDKQSLRGFVAQVERDLPEEILRIHEPVKTHLDITSLVFELEQMGKSPLVVFDHVEGHAMPVVTNVAG